MNSPFTVFVIDDDPIVLEIISAILEADYAVELFESVEVCVPRLEEQKPDMFLIDVSLPGMDGYSFCRQIKSNDDMVAIPVTFISSNDTLDARLKGYDAGGEDFIVKPFEAEEVLRKVKVAKEIIASKEALKEQAASANQFSMTMMSSMGETGSVIQFMGKLLDCNSERDVATALLDLLSNYGLQGVVQVRIAEQALTLSAEGSNIPAEVGILNHVRTLDRIFDFGKRSVYNVQRATLLVNNMPLDNPDYCGRLRDHLSLAAQGADSRLQNIEARQLNQRNQAGIVDALAGVRTAIDSLRQAHHQDRIAGSQLIMDLEQQLAKSFVHMGMSNKQERMMEELIGNFVKRLLALMDKGEEAYNALESLGERLGKLK